MLGWKSFAENFNRAQRRQSDVWLLDKLGRTELLLQIFHPDYSDPNIYRKRSMNVQQALLGAYLSWNRLSCIFQGLHTSIGMYSKAVSIIDVVDNIQFLSIIDTPIHLLSAHNYPTLPHRTLEHPQYLQTPPPPSSPAPTDVNPNHEPSNHTNPTSPQLSQPPFPLHPRPPSWDLAIRVAKPPFR